MVISNQRKNSAENVKRNDLKISNSTIAFVEIGVFTSFGEWAFILAILNALEQFTTFHAIFLEKETNNNKNRIRNIPLNR